MTCRSSHINRVRRILEYCKIPRPFLICLFMVPSSNVKIFNLWFTFVIYILKDFDERYILRSIIQLWVSNVLKMGNFCYFYSINFQQKSEDTDIVNDDLIRWIMRRRKCQMLKIYFNTTNVSLDTINLYFTCLWLECKCIQHIIIRRCKVSSLIRGNQIFIDFYVKRNKNMLTELWYMNDITIFEWNKW